MSTAFTSNQIDTIHAAYERTCAALQLSSTSDRLTELVVTKIIELAKAGELDAERLSEAALAHFGQGPRSTPCGLLRALTPF
jgi:hypothetical protein